MGYSCPAMCLDRFGPLESLLMRDDHRLELQYDGHSAVVVFLKMDYSNRYDASDL